MSSDPFAHSIRFSFCRQRETRTRFGLALFSEQHKACQPWILLILVVHFQLILQVPICIIDLYCRYQYVLLTYIAGTNMYY